MDDSDCTDILVLTHAEVQSLADRLVVRAVAGTATYSATERDDLLTASRALRRLLSAYERAAGHELQTIFLCGVV